MMKTINAKFCAIFMVFIILGASGCISGFNTTTPPRLPDEITYVPSNPAIECTALDTAYRDLENTGYLLMAPKTLFSGGEGAVSMAAFSRDTRNPIRRCISFSLVDKTGKKIKLVEGSTGSVGHTVASFKVPQLDEGSYTFIAEIEDFNQSFNGTVQIKNGAVLFIETDKPIYKPGQTIHGRILALNNDLKPMGTDITIEIADAKGIKVFKNISTTNVFGITTFDLPLARELNFGTWKISATADSTKSSIDIRVEKYVLPKFKVDVDLQKEWFLVDEKIQGSVSANYFFGKPVNGEVTIDAYRYVGTWEKYQTFSANLEDGKKEFALPQVGYVAGTYGAGGQGSLMLNISVKDTGGHVEKTSRLLMITRSPVVIQLIPETYSIKPGLPFQVLVVTETPDGKPLDRDVTLKVRYTDKRYREKTEDRDISTKNGVALVEFTAPEDVKGAWISATVKGEKAARSQVSLKSAYSPSSSFIHLVQVSEGIPKTGENIVFGVYSTNEGTVYYDVVASGRTVYSGTSDDRKISITVTPQMSPGAKIVAYMINPNSEISADSLPFDVEMTLPVDLKASFDKDEAAPGEDVLVKFDAGSLSIIGVSIVDESVFALNEGRLNIKQVFDELERRFMEPEAESHQKQPYRYASLRPVSAMDVIKDAGMQVLASTDIKIPESQKIRRPVGGAGAAGGGDMMVEDVLPAMTVWAEKAAADATLAPRATTAPSQEQPLAKVERVRQFFPETWIWEPMLVTEEDGKIALSLKAPDSITTWRLHAVSSSAEGIGMAETGIRVFQEFFVDPDLPYAVTRYEEFPVKMQVYNYLNTSQNILVELKKSDWFELLGDEKAELVVDPNGVESVSFTIRPKSVGIHPIEVTARSKMRADAVRKEIIVEPEGTTREIVENGILTPKRDVDFDAALPEGIVEDSGRVILSITPSIVGQTINGVEDLLQMPYGCGEQNMIFFAPDVEVLRYLKATGQLNPEIQAKAEFFITTGYQRELTFQHKDGSFSAFGENDKVGSLWLTAFVLSTFSSARDVYPVDGTVIEKAATWIEGNQNEDGSFDQIGFLAHQDLMGGLKGKYALTAYVTLALVEYGDGDRFALSKAQKYLEDNLDDAKGDPYALAIGALALKKLNSIYADKAMDALMELKKEDENGIYWGSDAVLMPEPTEMMGYRPPQPSASIETTAYAALVLMEAKDARANDAIKWIASKRNSRGGFTSTQDTVMAFKALMTAAVNQGRDIDATIRITSDGKTIKELTVDTGNFDVLQMVELPEDAGNVKLSLDGKGEVNYQIVKKFNVILPDVPVKSDIELNVTYNAENIAVDDVVDVTVRVRYIGEAESTGMLLVDVAVPTGFRPVVSSLDELKASGKISRYEVAGRKIILYVDDLKRDVELFMDIKVKAVFPVKAVIPDSKAYSYYNPEIRGEFRGREIVVNA